MADSTISPHVARRSPQGGTAGALFYRKIVLFGARGFLGRHLDAALTGWGAEVLRFDLPEIDITDPAAVRRAGQQIAAFRAGEPAACINAAGIMDGDAAGRDTERLYAINGIAPARLLALCRDQGVAAMIQLSSEAVFGAGESAFAEDAPRLPVRAYGISKLVAELSLEAEFGGELALLLLRLPVVVGIGQTVGNPVSIFCHEAASTGFIEIFRGGTHRRKFLAIDDVAAHIRALLAVRLAPGVRHYNAAGCVASMRELAAAVCAQVPDACIVGRDYDLPWSSLYTSSVRIQRDFGCVARTSLADMIAACLRPGGYDARARTHAARAGR